jgi:anaerobic magnesium-protoporphyrin IX monomethyl ester cyclase
LLTGFLKGITPKAFESSNRSLLCNVVDSPLFKDPCKTDLLLIFPPFQRLIVSMENIGIEYIAACARACGFDVGMINAGLYGLTVDDVIRIIKDSRFKVLGISTIHWTMDSALRIAKAARDAHPGSHIILGGIEAALSAEQILRNHISIDSIGMSEGEPTVTSLLSALTEEKNWRDISGLAFRDGDSVAFSARAPLIDPLDSLPFPARDDIVAVIEAGGPVSISSSRGCFGRCSFCSVRAFYSLSSGRPWRGRSPSSVISEMQELYERYNIRLFSFIDETVVGPGDNGHERLRELAALIRQSGIKVDFFMTVRADQVERGLFRELKEAGLKKVEIGIESMASSQLKRYSKNVRVRDNRRALKVLEDLGIAVEVFMIPFDSGVTPDELKKNLEFYSRRFENGSCRYDVAPLSMGNYLYPYPGTGTRTLYEQQGWLDGEHYLPFRAEDGRMQKVGEAMTWLVSFVEPAFPMSFLGLGNLWTNSASLPVHVYGKIGAVSAAIGTLLVEFARWALSVTAKSLPFSTKQIEEILDALRRFLSRLTPLKQEIRMIADTYAKGEQTNEVLEIEDPFARNLYLFGKQKKRLILENMYSRAVDKDAIITTLLNILTQEVEP